MTTFPQFISREDLPASLRPAYDMAAKGVKNDTTRINGENNTNDIDSFGEVLIFQEEFNKQKDKLDKFTYDNMNNYLEQYVKKYKMMLENEHYSKMRELGLLPTLEEMAKNSKEYRVKHSPVLQKINKFFNSVPPAVGNVLAFVLCPNIR